MQFFRSGKPKWLDEDTGKATSAVRWIFSHKKLARVVKESRDTHVCRLALRRLEDQDLLLDCALHAELSTVAAEAAKKLTDQRKLFEYVKARGDSESDVSRISRPELLAELALNASNHIIRAAAIRKAVRHSLVEHDVLRAIEAINDPKLLQEIAMSGKSGIAEKAVSRLNSQEFLASIAAEAENIEELNDVACMAVSKLENQELVARFALFGRTDSIRRAAFGRLTSQEALAKAYRCVPEGDDAVRLRMVESLDGTYQELLRHIAAHDDNPEIRTLAADKLVESSRTMERLDALRESVRTAEHFENRHKKQPLEQHPLPGDMDDNFFYNIAYTDSVYRPQYKDIGISYIHEENGRIIIEYRGGEEKVCRNEEVRLCSRCSRYTPVYSWYDAGAYIPDTRELCLKCGHEYRS